jgi:hypothetical protein
VGLAPHLAELPQLLHRDDRGDRLRDRLGLGRVEDARVFAGEDQGCGRPGLGRAGRRGSGGGEVADHDLAGAGPKPGPVGRAAGDLAGLDTGLLQREGRRRPGGTGALGGRASGKREWAACAHSCTVAPHKAG